MKYTTDSDKKAWPVLKQIMHYLSPHRPFLCFIIITSILSNVLLLLGPFLSGKAIDALGNGSGSVNFSKVFYYCGILVIFYVTAAILNYLLSLFMIRLGKSMACAMRDSIQEKLMLLNVSFFDSKQTGDIISTVSYDVDTLNNTITNDLLQILSSVLTLLVSFGMMISISPYLTAIFSIILPITVIITRQRLSKTRPLFKKRTYMLAKLNGYAEDTLSGLKTIQAYHQESVIKNEFSEKNISACDAFYQAEYQSGIIGPLMGFMYNASSALLGIFGSFQFMKGNITIGLLSSFILYSRRFSGPVNELATITGELQSALSAARRIFSLLDEPIEKKDNTDAFDLTNAKGDVSFDHVKFGYQENHLILKDVTLHASAGSTIAIVGSTGSGKTTIINLLMRFYDANSGTIRIDGHPITSLTRTSLRKSFSMVLQDTWLFDGTIKDNIAYGSEHASFDQIKQAAKAAYIDSFIESLPDGYDTILNDNGGNLSKGQKQLLTIARAMLSNASMLILDEATSNVDSRTELLIQSAMQKLMQGKTCFVIAHRLSTIQNADCILVLKDGTIKEQGTHESLLNQHGIYSDIYQSQFQ